MPTTTEKVADAFRRTDLEWILKDPQREQMLAESARQIDEFIEAYQQRYHDSPEPFRLLDENPFKAAAFFQAFTGVAHSTDIRLLIWRLLLGVEITSVRFLYTKGEQPSLLIATRSPYGERDEFQSNNLWDFRLFRQIGILGVGDIAILDGYFALQHS